MKKLVMLSLIIMQCALPNADQSFVKQNNIYAATIPKAGTNLLAKALSLMTSHKSRRYSSAKLLKGELPKNSKRALFSHIRFDESVANLFKKYDYKCLFMIRDPRDVVVSYTYWLVTQRRLHPMYVKKHKKDPSFFSDLLTRQIKDIKRKYDSYLPWMNDPSFYTVRFENLVGSKGGGSDKKQLKELKNISDHIGISLSDDDLQIVAEHLFGGTMTFRKGKTSSWKKHFTHEQKRLFKKVAGQLLIDLGYEKDFNW